MSAAATPVRTVLILEEAVSFGGAIVSTANLVRVVDPARYRFVFATAASAELVRSRLHEANDRCTVVELRKYGSYATVGRWVDAISGVRPRLLRRILGAGVFALRFVVNIPYMFRVWGLARRHQVDLVQLNNAWGNYEGTLVCWLLGLPTVRYFRGYLTGAHHVERFVLERHPGRFLSVSDHIKEIATADGVPPDLNDVATPPAIPAPTPPDVRRTVRARYGIPESAPVVANFGRVIEWKGQREFVRAAALVAAAVPEAHFLIVGDTSDGDLAYWEGLQALAGELGVRDRVHFTGYVDDVDAVYRSVDVVAHTAIEAEPSGRVVFEAMIHGLPLVASTLGGPREFIAEGVDGFLADPAKPEELAGKLTPLLRDPALRREVGERARVKIESQYGGASYARIVTRAYDLAIASREGR